MAQRVEMVLIDDLDGSAADQTVQFALDGTSYEIDLSDSNAEAMRSALESYLSVGRKVQTSGAKRRKALRSR